MKTIIPPTIPINIHRLHGDERGFTASNRNPISINGVNYHECSGDTPEQAMSELAEFLGANIEDFEIVHNEANQSEPI